MSLLTGAPVPTSDDIGTVDDLVGRKGATTVAVCVPARDEAHTIGAVVDTARLLADRGLVDEIVVVDDGSCDATAARASARGALVVPNEGGPGKGQALARAVNATTADLLVFLDADVVNLSERFVTGLVAPLIDGPAVQLVKGTYRRALHGRPGEGGRVTELMARPLLDRFFPPLAVIGQPLAGESAIRRSALQELVLEEGYGIEIALLIDVYRRWGIRAIAEVDLGERQHRNRPLDELRPQAAAVLHAVLARAPGSGA